MQGEDSAALSTAYRAESIRPDQKTEALIATSNCRLGNFKAAGESLKKLEPWPNDEAILAQIAECVERAGAPLDAVTVYQKLIQLEASPADKYAFGEARAYLRASRRILSQMRNLPENEIYSSALDNAKSAPPGDPSDTAFATAREHIPQISFDMPLSEMERLLAQFPADAKVSYCIGVVAGRRGMEAYQKATERFPDSLEIPFYEAEMLSETARKQEAIDVYRSIPAPGLSVRRKKGFRRMREISLSPSDTLPWRRPRLECSN